MALPVVARKVTKKITKNRKNIFNVQESEGSKKYFEQISEEERSQKQSKKKPNKQRNTIENVRLKIRMSDNIYSRVGTKHYKES